MLVQVQHQRERDGLDEDEEQTKTTDKKQLAIESASGNEESKLSENDQLKTELNEAKKDDGQEKDERKSLEPGTTEQNDVEMKEVENADGTVVKVENNDSEATEIVEADSHEKDLTIDPRTYCTLGHFHLLLEDYAKGESQKSFY